MSGWGRKPSPDTMGLCANWQSSDVQSVVIVGSNPTRPTAGCEMRPLPYPADADTDLDGASTSGGIGRRARLRISCSKGREGSSPSSWTKVYAWLRALSPWENGANRRRWGDGCVPYGWHQPAVSSITHHCMHRPMPVTGYGRKDEEVKLWSNRSCARLPAGVELPERIQQQKPRGGSQRVPSHMLVCANW